MPRAERFENVRKEPTENLIRATNYLIHGTISRDWTERGREEDIRLGFRSVLEKGEPSDGGLDASRPGIPPIPGGTNPDNANPPINISEPETNSNIPSTYLPPGGLPPEGTSPPVGASSNHALQDYQLQLMLLEQQNKKRLMMARQEEEETKKSKGGRMAVDRRGSNEGARLRNIERMHSAQSRGPASWGGPHDASPSSPQHQETRKRIEDLTEELQDLWSRIDVPDKPDPALLSAVRGIRTDESWVKIYRLDGHPYLGMPQWQYTDNGLSLVASTPLRNVDAFLMRNSQILFVIYQDYVSRASDSVDEDGDMDTLPPLKPLCETMMITRKLWSSLEELVFCYPDFKTIFPQFSQATEFDSPYLFLYYMYPTWEESAGDLDEFDQRQVQCLFKYVRQELSPQYELAIHQFSRGMVSSQTLPFLIKPGDVVINSKPHPQCFIATSWPLCEAIMDDEPPIRLTRQKGKKGKSRETEMHHPDESDEPPPMKFQTWKIAGWRWVFGDSMLGATDLDIKMLMHDPSREVEITSLDWHPIQYASQDVADLLNRRAETFWKCRERHFVGYEYREDDENSLDTTNERFMIDFDTFKLLHAYGTRMRRDIIGLPDATIDGLPMDMDSEAYLKGLKVLPSDGRRFIFPMTIPGYNIRQKKWMDIDVDQIRDVQWNKKAFESLAIDDETKHLVEALVSSQLKAEKSTDLIGGKGNGLLMLLHGGPGTGKTFTAESVAELAEKPLYRVTCGDIGTKPEDVEKYLESVLRLGKIWGCVVLLDEADVFLEERQLTDLNRNALVSVFLRVLEYYDGILILTSNRVGTFDQAFKSRIQLALHYEDLQLPQRRKIWRNFFNRLRELGEPSTAVDYDSLYDHIDELAQHKMNGRQIRNAITTGRQLAQFDGRRFSHEQLKYAIKVTNKFETYLKGVHGYSDEQLAREERFR